MPNIQAQPRILNQQQQIPLQKYPRKTIFKTTNQKSLPKLSIKKIKISQKAQPVSTIQTPSFDRSNIHSFLPVQPPCVFPCYNICNPCITYQPNFNANKGISNNLVDKKNIETDTNDLNQDQDAKQNDKSKSKQKQKQSNLKYFKKVYVPIPQLIPFQMPTIFPPFPYSHSFSALNNPFQKQSLRSKLKKGKEKLQQLSIQRELLTKHNLYQMHKNKQLSPLSSYQSNLLNLRRNKISSFRKKYQNQVLNSQRQYNRLEKRLKSKFHQDLSNHEHINNNHKHHRPQHQHVYKNTLNPELQFQIERRNRNQSQQHSNKLRKQLIPLSKYLY